MSARLLLSTALFGAAVFADLGVFPFALSITSAVALAFALRGRACHCVAVALLCAFATDHDA